MIGGVELLIVIFIALLLFGPKKIPEIARTLGEAVREFRRASNPLLAAERRPIQLGDDELLIKVARELGISVEGRSRDEIAREIVERARAKNR